MVMIKHLPPTLIAQIAAGEVIDRPGSVVKELLENSLDAGATQITITILGGGLELIRVIDNGAGMGVDDLRLAALAHTTSKLHQLSDLDKISSYGFRGEALASIAAVAELSIASRPAAQPRGYQLISQAGTVSTPQPFGMGTGTQISVAELFQSIPARKKFLQQSQRELKHITQVIIDHALINFNTTFVLEHNGRTLLHFAACEDLFERARQYFSDTVLNLSFPINHNDGILQVTGLLGSPQLAKPGTQQQYLYINARPVTNPGLKNVVRKAYSNIINPRHQPAYVLDLKIRTELVDINVHPRKEIVTLLEESKVAQLLYTALKERLKQPQATMGYFTGDQPQKNILVVRDQDQSNITTPNSLLHPSSRASSAPLAQRMKKLYTAWSPTEVAPTEIIQIDQTYLGFPVATGLVLIDQHAAHERILFEQYQQSYQQAQSTNRTVELPESLSIELDPLAMQTFTEHQTSINQLGFSVEVFDEDSVIMTHHPQLLDTTTAQQLFLELLTDLADHQPIREASTQIDRTIAYLACRQAVKAGDYLSPNERLRLITKLSQTPHSQTCPHGRPTSWLVATSELKKRFKR